MLRPHALLVALAGCGGASEVAPAVCAGAEGSLQIGEGSSASGFIALEEGDDVAMWPVRHDWNRLLFTSVRVEGFLSADDADGGVRISVGLYQEDGLVGGTVEGGLQPAHVEGEARDYLGLRPKIERFDYQSLSGKPTEVEAKLTTTCERGLASRMMVRLWSPEDLCRTDPPLGKVILGGGERETGFVLPGELATAPVVETSSATKALRLGARVSNPRSPLNRAYLLHTVELAHAGAMVGRLVADRGPTWWSAETTDFLGVEVPFEAAYAPAPGDRVDVLAELIDACGRRLYARSEVELTVAP